MFGNIFRSKPEDYYNKKENPVKDNSVLSNPSFKKFFRRKRKDLEYYRTEGAAHVGINLPKEKIKKNKIADLADAKEEIYQDLENKLKPRKRKIKFSTRQIEENKTPKRFRKNPEGSKFKEAITGAYPKDNLKTELPNKTERRLRGETREVLHNPNSWEEVEKLRPEDLLS